MVKETRYLVHILGQEVRDLMGTPHDDHFLSSTEPPSPFYESASEGGDDDIPPEVDDVEYMAPQERYDGEGTSGPPMDEAAEQEDEDQLSQDRCTQFFLFTQMSS